jgi:hypothetical protein
MVLPVREFSAANTLGEELAREGLDLAMWAGPRKKGRQLIKLAASSAEPKRLDTAYRYEVEVGFPPNPPPVGAPFPLAPEIKSEALIFRRLGGLKMLPLRGSCRAATEGVSAQELVWAGFICI